MSDDVNAQKLVNEAIERNLERNRQHAKSTRLRKKEMLEVMKSRIIELQKEVKMPFIDSLMEQLQ